MSPKCATCPYGGAVLWQTGPADARVVIVTEAPGVDNSPAYGQGAALLNRMIAKLCGEHRFPIRFTSALACHPTTADQPYEAGIEACGTRLLAEIAEFPRTLVLALGGTALQALTGKKEIGKYRGQILHTPDGTPVLATFHPNTVLRNTHNYRYFAQDIEQAVRIGLGMPVPNPGISSGLLVETEEEAAKWVTALLGCELLSVDIETTGLNPRVDTITYIGLCFRPGNTVIFPRSLLPMLAPLWTGTGKRPSCVYHNGQFDTKFFQAVGLEAQVDHDTMLLHYCLNEQPGTHGLKQLANDRLGANDYEDELHEYMAKTKTGWGDVPPEILLPYLAKDCDYTFQLFQILYPLVCSDAKLSRLYHQLLLPASRMLNRVERNGVWIDQERVTHACTQLRADKERAASVLQEYAAVYWDDDAFRSETGCRTNISGPASSRYNFGRLHTLWLLEQMGATLTNLSQRTISNYITENHPSTVCNFLHTYRGYTLAEAAVRKLERAKESGPNAELDQAYDRRDRAKTAMEAWEQAYWNGMKYVAQHTIHRRLLFNPGSPAQVLWLLRRMGLKPLPDTKEATLKPFIAEGVVDALLAYREAAKALSTYAVKFGNLAMAEADGRIHASFKLHGTVTGRLSSSDPNIQNIPRNPLLRAMLAAPPGRVLVEADLSQAELRVLAHVSGDPFLAGVYERGEDLHSQMAKAIFGPDFTDEQRTASKTINFGIAYGLGASGLATQLGIEEKAAEAMIEGWYVRLPKAKAYLESCRRAPLEGKVLETA
ncbi:MAG: hypothetical protein JWN15_3169, partial [Firmicutes bacterium]|nr:hypothetical protein [Bacillota bacterium]